ncbi:hypothetical protein Pcinc_021704 [Petrolisthes cinctipes]|uniref:COMM domain-containing protein n=1 Tax=Petrolisthes cinctipes TaxID=88211 RepID=A0AAE1KI16_PETCI|nr:hypothetical protein Pcinc_021704 [Petrolisthes cinctipes]
MPLTISEDLKAQLSLLTTQNASVLQEFCRLANQYYRQEINPKIYNSASNKLGVQPSQVEDAVRALVFLLIHCTKAKASKLEVEELATSLNFTKDAVKVLADAYTNNEGDIKEYMKSMGVQVPHYNNLEWRFDILAGSRALHHIAEPLITLQLFLDHSSGIQQQNKEDGSGGKCEKILLQTDPNNLVHMTNVLEEALQEARTHHSRRVQQYLK